MLFDFLKKGSSNDDEIETITIDGSEPIMLEDKAEQDTTKSYVVYPNGNIGIVDDKNSFKYKTLSDLKVGLDNDFNFAYVASQAAYNWAASANIGDMKAFGNHMIKVCRRINYAINNPAPFMKKPTINTQQNVHKPTDTINDSKIYEITYEVTVTITPRAVAKIDRRLTEQDVLDVVRAMYANNEQIVNQYRTEMRKLNPGGNTFKLYGIAITAI